MDAKHTPGPWRVAYLDNACQRVVMQDHIEICTCWHHSVGSLEKEMEANAALIAAAPDMAAELTRLRAERAEMVEALERCRAQFQFYANQHTKAGKTEKATTNRSFAIDIRALLARVKGEG